MGRGAMGLCLWQGRGTTLRPPRDSFPSLSALCRARDTSIFTRERLIGVRGNYAITTCPALPCPALPCASHSRAGSGATGHGALSEIGLGISDGCLPNIFRLLHYEFSEHLNTLFCYALTRFVLRAFSYLSGTQVKTY